MVNDSEYIFILADGGRWLMVDDGQKYGSGWWIYFLRENRPFRWNLVRPKYHIG